jgi:kynurenine formamidase
MLITLITIADIEAWEKTNGKLPDDIIILLRTGYGSFYPDAIKYLGTDERGACCSRKTSFPGIDPAAAEWLVKKQEDKRSRV